MAENVWIDGRTFFWGGIKTSSEKFLDDFVVFIVENGKGCSVW